MSYLPLANKARAAAISCCVRKLRKSGLEFDGIACSGTSGLLVAPGVASRLKKKLVLLRPKGQKSHGDLLEFARGADGEINNYVIIDDFVETGSTIRRILRNLDEEFCVGVCLYRDKFAPSDLKRFLKNKNIVLL